MKQRLGPIRIEYWCDGCGKIQHYQGGSIGCKETGNTLDCLALTYNVIKVKVKNVIPTPKSCPYLKKLTRKEKLNEINENLLGEF